MKNTGKAYLAMTLQALIIGFSFMFVKIALRSAEPITLLAHRFTVAVVFVFIYRFFSKCEAKPEPKNLVKIVLLSAAYPISFFLFQTLGLQIISSSEAGIVQATVPILTLIIAGIVLKERIGSMQKLCILLSVLGVVLINLMNGFEVQAYSYWGFVFVFISTTSFAVYNVLARKLLNNSSILSIVSVTSIMGCLVFNLVFAAQHLGAGSISSYFQAFSDPTYVLAILYLGAVSSLLSSFLSTYALANLGATKVGLFSNVATVVTIFAGTVFLQEPLEYYHYLGVGLILLGTIGFNLLGMPKVKKAKTTGS